MTFILPLMLFFLLASILVRITQNKDGRPPISFSRRTGLYMSFGYVLILVVAAVVVKILPVSDETLFQPVDQAEFGQYKAAYSEFQEGRMDSVNSPFIVRKWHQLISDNQLLIKPRTVGSMPVKVVIERIPGDSDTIDTFVFDGKLIMDDYEVQGYTEEIVIEPQANVLTVWERETPSYVLSYFEHDGVMTQFTSDTSFENNHTTSEWRPILYLKIPESIEVTIDESIKDQVTEL